MSRNLVWVGMSLVSWQSFGQTVVGTPPNFSTLEQGPNSLNFRASEATAQGSNFLYVDFETERTKILNVTNTPADGRWREGEFVLDSESATLAVIRENGAGGTLEGMFGVSLEPLLPEPIFYGGLLYYQSDSDDFDDFYTMEWTRDLTGFVGRQSGSTWYGDLSMNPGTTFTADNLTASSITTGSLQASTISSNTIATSSLIANSIRSTSITTGSLSVTGNASIGGTLNMNNNRITNVGDGVEPTDAVNLRQLQRTQSQIDDVRKESRGGISGVAALAGIPSVPAGSDGVLGVGVGSYKGESSLAVGGSRKINDKATIKFGISTTTTNNEVVGSFGIGIKW
jgi:hypothetical protein